MVVCNEAHRFLVAEQLRALKVTPRAIVLEPFGRNTAPAIALAALAALRDAGEVDPLLLVLPADHVIRDTAAFQQAVRTALPAARAGAAGDLRHRAGQPRRPATATSSAARRRARSIGIARFVEKPDLARARQFLAAGDYYWNSGMFLFRAGPLPRGAGAPGAADVGGLPRRLRGGTDGPGFHARGRRCLRALPRRLHRLCGDGKDRRGRGGAAGCRLERCRLLVGAA